MQPAEILSKKVLISNIYTLPKHINNTKSNPGPVCLFKQNKCNILHHFTACLKMTSPLIFANESEIWFASPESNFSIQENLKTPLFFFFSKIDSNLRSPGGMLVVVERCSLAQVVFRFLFSWAACPGPVMPRAAWPASVGSQYWWSCCCG